LLADELAKLIAPFTERAWVGPVVPIPTFPPAITFNPLVPPTLKSDEKRLVEEAVVEKKLVVVAEVPVALTKVKFWRVEEAVAKTLAKVPRVVAIILAKVGEAVVLTDWSNQSFKVGAPFTVKAWPLTVRDEVKRLVEEAVVEKNEVVVALPAVSVDE